MRISIPEKREYIFRKSMEFLLINNIFDDEGRIRSQFTEEEIQKMKLFQYNASKEYFESVGLDTQGVTNINEFCDKYKIDKKFYYEYLIHRKREIDMALNQLNKDNPLTG
jgi:hypothetical protein